MDFIYCLIPVILLALFVLFSGLRMLYSRARGYSRWASQQKSRTGLTFIFRHPEHGKVDIRHQDRRVRPGTSPRYFQSGQRGVI